MHRVAEEGIAAHWKYKAGDVVTAKDEQRLAWVRQLMEWQREMSDPNEFMSTLKIDLYPEEVYTFTPKGKVVVLPKDASPIDFAYAIHTEVGNTTIGAKVNGRIVPLRTKLRNGDIVEISTQAGHAPSPRLALLHQESSRARNKIKHWLNEHQRERAIEIGQKLLEREARKYKLSLSQVHDGRLRSASPTSTASAPSPSCSPASASANTPPARSSTSSSPAAPCAAEAAQPSRAPSATRIGQMSDAVKRVFFGKGSDSLQVEGQDDLLVYRARCCNPIRGEEIIGYVTRGKGVAVHARSCPNVQNLLYESDRRIQVEWAALAATQARRRPEAHHLPRQAHRPLRRPRRPAQGVHRHHLRRRHQHPLRRLQAHRRRQRRRRLRHRNRRRPPPQPSSTQNLRKVPGVRDVQRVQKI